LHGAIEMLAPNFAAVRDSVTLQKFSLHKGMADFEIADDVVDMTADVEARLLASSDVKRSLRFEPIKLPVSPGRGQMPTSSIWTKCVAPSRT
jgi:hypothetical protein